MTSRAVVAGAPSAYQPYEEAWPVVKRRAHPPKRIFKARASRTADRSDVFERSASSVNPNHFPLLIALVFSVLVLFANTALADDFDHQHKAYADVLENHVEWNEAGTASTVDYDALKANPDDFNQYLSQLSNVEKTTFERWNKNQQLAFLINAYNAFTLKLIVDHYPVGSIRDIGAFWQNPWEKRFFTLLGEDMHLDQVEHDIIREPGRYNEPRIHFAVNCASIGCPALRTEPFTAQKLEQQLEDSTRRFLRDESRNRYRDSQLEVSSIFKWYREDFERGWLGIDSLNEFFLRYADSMQLNKAQQEQLRQGNVRYRFLDYDWTLNSKGAKL